MQVIQITEQQLINWINQLLKEHKIYKFYQSPQWRTLRADVMWQHHNECVKCRKVGRITKATTVHHVHHVKDYPQYALSQYVYKDGQRIVNLVPLCDGCHNKEHPEKFDKHRKRIEKTHKKITEEKW